jgi:hypothetical protein
MHSGSGHLQILRIVLAADAAKGGHPADVPTCILNMECMVDGSSWSPLLDGRVGRIFMLRLKYIGICWSTFGAKTSGWLATKEKCHFNKLSMAITMAN